jgi:hypothetical protein
VPDDERKPLAAAVGAALTHQLTTGQIQQELLELWDAAVDPVVLPLVVIAEQAAVAAGFTLRIGILQGGLDRRQWVAQAPMAHLQRCAAQLPQRCGALHQSAQHPSPTLSALVEQQGAGLFLVRHQLSGDLAAIELEGHLDAPLQGVLQAQQLQRRPGAGG